MVKEWERRYLKPRKTGEKKGMGKKYLRNLIRETNLLWNGSIKIKSEWEMD